MGDKTKKQRYNGAKKETNAVHFLFSLFCLNSAVGISGHGSLLQIFTHYFISFYFDEAIDAYILPLSFEKNIN